MTRYIDLADFLIIAEAVLGIDAKVLARSVRIDLAESALYSPSSSFDGIEFYQGFALKAAVLVMHLVKNHPLPDGNKRSSYVCLREFVHRNNYTWKTGANDEIVSTMIKVASDDITLEELTKWISSRILPA
ncbi:MULTISPECIES: type II toxin-antitoxin system death-on-curing family toxin [Acidithrix]|uniref:Toxin Doc n=2 Tax=root TaxID=1 RepID=A0A0D8HG81_9ACTN|nr:MULTISPECIES: type II toxin-antitoxin system death-on-curing family toxin [Acidithrix]KJF16076.1 toxin Doc [Acidithrix ferrooxidans]